MVKYSFHAPNNSDWFSFTSVSSRNNSAALNPPLRAKRTGVNQNFARFASRSTCTCGGSTRSAE